MINQCINPKLRLLAIGLACILFGSLIMSFLGAFEALGAENEIETPFDNSAKSKTALTSHAPIYINSNSQFTAANGVVSGSGTASNPYIIEGWDINAKTKNGIDIRNTTAYFTIRNCCIHDGKSNYKYGIYFYNVKNGRIENVTSYNNYHGIYLHKSSCNQIVNSASYNNYDYGIWLHGSRECIDSYETTVVNTPVYRNYVGIYIYYSHRNKITGCQIYNNSDTGIWLSQTYKNGSNVITENLIQNNGYGAKLTSCADYNFIYHNDFIDNARQAYDEESYGGSWDNGYPSGGNYWSDYTGTDSYSGPNQDQPGSDGIGDTPYEIPTYYFDTYAEDRYPLMRSFNIPKNQPPNASFIYSPDTPTTDTVIQFTDTSTDSDGYIVSWYWDFGDRNSSTLQNPTHRYTVYGNYTVTLTVEDNGSAKSSFSRTIFVLPTNWPPVASFDYSPRYPTTNDIIQFNDTSTDSDGYIVAWYWDFGDGNNSTAQNPKHRYTKDGIYKVILRVEDNGSAAGWCSSFIRVAPNQPPTIDITYPVDKQVVKEVVVIKGTASDADSIVTNVYVRIDNASWDDIAVSPAQSLSWEKAWNTTKVLNGLHTIYARAYDGVDYSEIKSAKVYVYNPAPAPIVTITYPEEGQKVNSTVTITGTAYKFEPELELRLYPHESICIDGNSNFLSKNSGVIAGLGTADSPYIIEGWEIDASRATGIEIRNTNAYFVIYGCKIHSGMDINHHGIYLHNVSNARIENVILEANHFGIYARNCNRITINHCKMYDNSHNGINIWHSLSVEIANCLSYQNVFGISFVNTSESSIANCILYNNTYGILLTHTSDRNLIATSRIYNNFCGVCFADLANSNTLRQCELYNNTHGVFLNRTADNKIYHNNFINNSNQSFDNNANYWDNGYPSGGNYWSDYDGVDANGDGIGDSPYYIPNATGKDDYPLIRPVDITIPEFEGGLFVEVKLDNDLWQLANGAANWNFIWNTITVSNGWHTIYARAYDGIAYSEIKFVNVYVDNPIPEIIFFAINNGALYTNSTSVTLTLLANNATYMHFSNDNITWSDWLSYASTTSWELPSGDGIKVVYAQVVSSVGIPSVIVSDDITLDTTPPEITDIQAIPRTQTEGGWVNISCKVVDNIGVAEVRLNIAGPTPFTPVNITMTKVAGMDIYYFNMSYSVLGNYSFYIWANDIPSNQNKSAVYYFEIIPTPLPDLAVSSEDITILPSDTVSNGTTITINATIHNIGSAEAYDVTVRFYVNNALIDTKTILSLLPTEAIILSTTWVATPAGNYTIKVVIDPDNMIAESDETNNEATKLLTIVVENIPPVADFVFYQGVRAVHGEVLNITLRVAGEKGAIVNLTVYENGIKVGFISVERIPGPPQENTTAVVIDASKLYTILLERSARKEGENPVWVIVECKGVSNMTHYVFQENDTKELNLTHTIDQMLLATGFVKFDARFPISYDPDGTIINYTWSFGDGFYGYGEIVYHNYAPGNYIVNLTVRDDDGAIGIVTKTITILEQTGDFANSRKQFGIALRCPADLTITNGTGAFVGLNVSSGRHENWIPNASVIIAGDIEIYFAPGDFNYTYTIRGLGPGDFVLVFAPGDFAPGDFSYRIYELESSTNAQTQDILRITQNGDKIILTSNTDKFYSLWVRKGEQIFALKDVPINRNSTHNYTITNWSALASQEIPAVSLAVDDMPDKVWQLWNNFDITDIFKPDLAIVKFKISKLQAKIGENITVRATLKNLGNCPAKNIRARFLVNNQSYGEEYEILLLPRGDSREITFYWSGRVEDRYLLAVWVDPDNLIKELKEDNNLESATIEIIKEQITPVAPPALPSAAIIGGAIATTIVVVAALLGTEVGKYSLFSLIAPLYIKRKYAVLDQFTRGRIYEHIKLNPGTHYNSIKSSLDLGNGTLSYHLTVLEKEGYIRSETEGIYKRFYLAGRVNTMEKAHLPLSDLQQELINQIRAKPGITQKELSTFTGKSHQVISYNIKVLARLGIVNEYKEGMKRKLYLDEKYAG